MKNVMVVCMGLVLAFLIGSLAPHLSQFLPDQNSIFAAPQPVVDWSGASEMTPSEVQRRLSVPLGTPMSPPVHKERCSPTPTTYFCEVNMSANECYESWVNGNRNHIACYCAHERPTITGRVRRLIQSNCGARDVILFNQLVEHWKGVPNADYSTV